MAAPEQNPISWFAPGRFGGLESVENSSPSPGESVGTHRSDLLARLVLELDSGPTSTLAARTIDVIEAAEGISNVTVWLADYGYERLTALGDSLVSKGIEGSPEGRALIEETSVAEGGRVHVPLGRRGQVIGVLSADSDEAKVGDLTPLSIAVCSALVASQGHSDLLPVLRGAQDLELPATIQHQLLPLLTYNDEVVEIGGLIEPAYDIAGDAFDYAVNDDVVHMAVFDAVGHGLRASIIAMVAVGAYRQSRRSAQALDELASSIDEALAPTLHRGEYVTGLLIEVDPSLNQMSIWNAGHLPPILARDGAGQTLDKTSPNLPFGLGGAGAGEPHRFELLPGDLLMLYSDGVIQARDLEGTLLGQEFLVELAAATAMSNPLRLLCRDVADRVRSHVGGVLRDDATILALRLAS